MTEGEHAFFVQVGIIEWSACGVVVRSIGVGLVLWFWPIVRRRRIVIYDSMGDSGFLGIAVLF